MSQRSSTDELAPPPRVAEVSEGIYAYLQPAGQWGLNNSAVLVGSHAVTLIDTCFTQRRTQALLDAVRGISHRPIATLFNTHEHGDHIWATSCFPSPRPSWATNAAGPACSRQGWRPRRSSREWN